MSGIEILLLITIIVMSVVIHEVSHGFVAYFLGDPTAKYAGRLTLNPIPHLDPIGSVLLPAVLILLFNFGFGYAKPVPYNPYNLRNQRWGAAMVSAAGPLSNLFIAIVFGLAIRFLIGIEGAYVQLYTAVLVQIVIINIVLAVFNLVPIYPLDGSKVLFSVLPYRFQQLESVMEQYGFIFLLVFIVFLFPILQPIISFLFQLFTGSPLV